MTYNFTNFNSCLRAKVLGSRNTSLQKYSFLISEKQSKEKKGGKKGREKLTVKNCNMCILWPHSCIPILTFLFICVRTSNDSTLNTSSFLPVLTSRMSPLSLSHCHGLRRRSVPAPAPWPSLPSCLRSTSPLELLIFTSASARRSSPSFRRCRCRRPALQRTIFADVVVVLAALP